VVIVVAQTSAMAQDVSALFEEARSTAVQLSRDANTMESFSRSNLSWKGHGTQITQIQEHINKAGQILSQMQSARGGAQQWHQDAIDGITPILKELASNTEAIIHHLNENPNRLKDPTYVEYLRSNAQLANQLSAAVGNVVDFDKTKTRMQEMEGKMGPS
jgi:hypothetical protein